MSGRKNILKRSDYDMLRIVYFEFLPPSFDGDVMFVFPPPTSSNAAQSKAKFMEGMDKQYDGHIWKKTMTTNISNNLSLAFRSSICISHLECHNLDCEYLQRAHQTSIVNDSEFEGFTKEPFRVGGPPPIGSTLVCKICKEPPICKARQFVMLESSMSMAMTQCNGPTFISDTTAIPLRLMTIDVLVRRLMLLLRSMLKGHCRCRLARLLWRLVGIFLVSTFFAVRTIHLDCFP